MWQEYHGIPFCETEECIPFCETEECIPLCETEEYPRVSVCVTEEYHGIPFCMTGVPWCSFL